MRAYVKALSAVAATFAMLTMAACNNTASDNSAEAPSAPAEASSEATTEAATEPASQAPATSDVTIIDVRTPEEFAEGHLQGAINIDFYADNFAQEIAKLDLKGNYALYCRSGNRAGQTLAIMEQVGFTQVSNLGSVADAAKALNVEVVTD